MISFYLFHIVNPNLVILKIYMYNYHIHHILNSFINLFKQIIHLIFTFEKLVFVFALCFELNKCLNIQDHSLQVKHQFLNFIYYQIY